MPSRRAENAAATIDGVIYLPGGLDPAGDATDLVRGIRHRDRDLVDAAAAARAARPLRTRGARRQALPVGRQHLLHRRDPGGPLGLRPGREGVDRARPDARRAVAARHGGGRRQALRRRRRRPQPATPGRSGPTTRRPASGTRTCPTCRPSASTSRSSRPAASSTRSAGGRAATSAPSRPTTRRRTRGRRCPPMPTRARRDGGRRHRRT